MTRAVNSLIGIGFNAGLGMTLIAVGPDRVTATIEVSGNHLQPAGIVHGGVHCAIVETLASIGAGEYFCGPGRRVVGVNNSTDFFRAVGEGSRLSAEATPVHRGRTQQLWVVRITATDGRLVSQGAVRLANLEPSD
jgi:uncharacterized protein (TIGR00369 family)